MFTVVDDDGAVFVFETTNKLLDYIEELKLKQSTGRITANSPDFDKPVLLIW